MPAVSVLRPLPADGYQPHPLHAGERAWSEANCYVDLWIETLHAMGLDPHAMLPFCLAIGWEADQWTFFKPPLADLDALYGVELEELCIWDTLAAHTERQLAAGRLVIVEADSWFLPDTHGVNYRVEHGKTAVCVQAIDRGARRLGYFHNGGYYTCEGEDYDGVLRVEALAGSMAPYVELVRLGAVKRLGADELRAASRALAAAHLRRRPANPVGEWRARFADELEWLRAQPIAAFHRWAFATLRQLGSAAQLGARWAAWLDPGLAPAVAALERVRDGAKTLQFKVARAVNGKKPLDADAALGEIEASWRAATELCASAVGSG
jgi:hypothetical protein